MKSQKIILCFGAQRQPLPRRGLWQSYKYKKTTSAGFEPARAKPNELAVRLLNHSDTMSFVSTIL